MWVSPNHPDPPAKAPPRETGRRLATFPRGRSPEGREQELRVALDEYRGREYLALRIWESDPSGDWWPTRKGVSVRLGEARGVADALCEAMDLVESREARR